MSKFFFPVVFGWFIFYGVLDCTRAKDLHTHESETKNFPSPFFYRGRQETTRSGLPGALYIGSGTLGMSFLESWRLPVSVDSPSVRHLSPNPRSRDLTTSHPVRTNRRG